MSQQHAEEIVTGQRFEFGENWRLFLEGLTDTRIRKAEQTLQAMLGSSLAGVSFVDVGCGSGLFSLAARRLGARVCSFDYDPASVACARELKSRFFPEDADWRVFEGSALDRPFVASLGTFDVVYSWGVLHHTGSMWAGLENVISLAAPGSRLFVAIYNDGGRSSRLWHRVKKAYNWLPRPLRPLVLVPSFVVLWGPATLRDLVVGRPFRTWRDYQNERGMSPWRDVLDWVGGYPYEYAKPEEIFDFYRDRGFSLLRLRTWGGGQGCNEFVFTRTSSPS
jgi:SAM-dependent methyltransferase